MDGLAWEPRPQEVNIYDCLFAYGLQHLHTTRVYVRHHGRWPELKDRDLVLAAMKHGRLPGRLLLLLSVVATLTGGDAPSPPIRPRQVAS